jgi:hypothetical protein
MLVSSSTTKHSGTRCDVSMLWSTSAASLMDVTRVLGSKPSVIGRCG